ncbi:hypothetical protein JCM8547_007691 [Rhodosporidiobolus lusitaniae]
MPVYKQIVKQVKRAKRKVEALLSDEEDDSGSDSERSQDEHSNSDSDESGSDDDFEEDDGLGGDADEVQLGEDDARPPPAGFPTAEEALENPVASTASLIAAMKEEGEDDDSDDEDDDEEAPLVCVFCPNKVLKQGKMTEVHLASKDHKRRLNRFKAHLESPDFPSEHRLADARWVASQLDKAVHERLSLQTQVGGKKAGTVKPDAPSSSLKPAVSKSTANDAFFSTATPSASVTEIPSKKGKGKGKAASTRSTSITAAAPTPSSPAPEASTSSTSAVSKAAAIAAAEEAGTSVREQLRQQKKDRSEKIKEKKRARKDGKKEKNERIKKRKIESGEAVTPHIPSKKPFVEKVRPSDEEIAARQAWKKARDEAKAAGKPIPPRPVLAYEHGGKVPEKAAKGGKPVKGGKAGKGGEEKKEKVVNEARMAQRKAKNERRKAKKLEAKEKAEKEVLPEV